MTSRTAIIVGGGFYGSAIAVHLARRGWRVTLVEREASLLSRASYVNQARLHNGCHYPRSFATAIRSSANLPYFREIYAPAVYGRFRAAYAIASSDSRVSSQHYQRFCNAVNIKLSPAKRETRALFDSKLVEAVYEVDEPAFDATALRDQLVREISELKIAVHYENPAIAIGPMSDASSELGVQLASGETLPATWVFNCTYAALNHVDGRTRVPRPTLRHQIAEVALIQPPEELKDIGITLMDGPFFSTMPFPARQLHSLTHVRYTHHFAWTEGGTSPGAPARRAPYEILASYLEAGGNRTGRSRVNWMLHDAQRFVPALTKAKVEDSLFEVKTFVTDTEVDDARPVFFHQDKEMPKLISILGAKIDNIFDILTYVDRALDQA